MTEPDLGLEAKAITWATNIISQVVEFQQAVGAIDAAGALTKLMETDEPATFGSHGVVEVDGGDLKRDGDEMQGMVQVAVTLLLAPAGDLTTNRDQLRRVRKLQAAIRAAFRNAGRHVVGLSWIGPDRLPDGCGWPGWYGSITTVRAIGVDL